MINQDHFASADSREFVDFIEALAGGPLPAILHLFKAHGIGGGFARLRELIAALGKKFNGFAAERFNTVLPLCCGPYAVRVRLKPVGNPPPAARSRDIVEDMRERLAVGRSTGTSNCSSSSTRRPRRSRMPPRPGPTPRRRSSRWRGSACRSRASMRRPRSRPNVPSSIPGAASPHTGRWARSCGRARSPDHALQKATQQLGGAAGQPLSASISASRPFTISSGGGGQPGTCRSTGRMSASGPTTAGRAREDAAIGRAVAQRHDPFGLGRGVVGPQQRLAHVPGDRTGDQQHVGMTRRGHEFQAEALDVVDRIVERHGSRARSRCTSPHRSRGWTASGPAAGGHARPGFRATSSSAAVPGAGGAIVALPLRRASSRNDLIAAPHRSWPE